MTDAATGNEIQRIFDMDADASGIAYGRACRLVMGLIGC